MLRLGPYAGTSHCHKECTAKQTLLDLASKTPETLQVSVGPLHKEHGNVNNAFGPLDSLNGYLRRSRDDKI